jgi:hypothetical protein
VVGVPFPSADSVKDPVKDKLKRFGLFDRIESSTPCGDGFGLSLPLEWCSHFVQLEAIWGMSVEVGALMRRVQA